MDVTAVGIEETSGTVSYRYAGVADELLSRGNSLRQAIGELEAVQPGHAGGRALVYATYARERVALAADIVEYVQSAGANPRCRFALLMCAEGWVGWTPRIEPQRARRALVVEHIEAVADELEAAIDALDAAGGGMSADAVRARSRAHEEALRIARASMDILANDERGSMDFWHRLRLEDAVRALLQAATPERSPRTRRRHLDDGLEQLRSALDAARAGLARRTARSLWLPGSEVWPVRGREILAALDRVADAIAASRQETCSSQDLLTVSKRVPQRRAKGYRDEARAHARLAAARARKAGECLNEIDAVETDLETGTTGPRAFQHRYRRPASPQGDDAQRRNRTGRRGTTVRRGLYRPALGSGRLPCDRRAQRAQRRRGSYEREDRQDRVNRVVLAAIGALGTDGSIVYGFRCAQTWKLSQRPDDLLVRLDATEPDRELALALIHGGSAEWLAGERRGARAMAPLFAIDAAEYIAGAAERLDVGFAILHTPGGGFTGAPAHAAKRGSSRWRECSPGAAEWRPRPGSPHCAELNGWTDAPPATLAL